MALVKYDYHVRKIFTTDFIGVRNILNFPIVRFVFDFSILDSG